MSIDIVYKGHVAELVLNNPGKRNALDLETSQALGSAVEEAVGKEATKVLVIAAEGKAFCAGGSLDELITAQENPESLKQIYAGFLAVAECPLPTVALVQGAAVGAGMNLALACDIRLTTPQALFDTRFMQLGIHCGGGHSWMLERVLGWEKSVAMLLFGLDISGEEAVRRGLALDCVPGTEIRDHALSLAAQLAEVPRELLINSKKTLAQAAAEPEHRVMVEHEFAEQARSLTQPHAVERLAALKARISRRK